MQPPCPRAVVNGVSEADLEEEAMLDEDEDFEAAVILETELAYTWAEVRRLPSWLWILTPAKCLTLEGCVRCYQTITVACSVEIDSSA